MPTCALCFAAFIPYASLKAQSKSHEQQLLFYSMALSSTLALMDFLEEKVVGRLIHLVFEPGLSSPVISAKKLVDAGSPGH